MKVWKTVESNQTQADQIAQEMDIPLPAAVVFSGLGFARLDEISRFLNPRLMDMSDPFLLPDMELVVQRIWQALASYESIAVFGDYDVDGITSTGLLTTILRKLGASNVTPCLPNRVTEGYGLTVDAVARCIETCHPKLLVTVDCGTNSANAARFALRQGTDVIVTDHHEASSELPDVHAHVNPKLGTDEGLKTLAGVGVVFKLCHALIKYGRDNGYDYANDIDLRDYLEWVALGTVTDIVPLLGENRIMVRHGLARLTQTSLPGWTALLDVAGIRGPINTYHVGFCLGPRLNAAGRLSNPDSALELLLTDDARQANEIAAALDAANRERQQIESKICSEARAEIDSFFDDSTHFGLVTGRQGWHPGVIGIVASRLAATYQRPVVVVAFDEAGKGRGSCRSIEGYNLLNALEQCSDDLITFGGHKMAAGLEINYEQFGGFRTRFNEVAASELKDHDFRPVQRVHAWLDLNQADESLLNALERLRPFGQGNPRPVLAVREARVVNSPQKVGANHLRLTLESRGTRRSAIAFGMADRGIPEGPVDVAFYLQRNSYMGNDSLQLNIQDIRASEE